ncbi:peptidoglycan bridge formation glycyltransferase FemA/FemB family protein [Candidatus Microgenomates bacterium]|nr:peptidoglycan bridge formation glycyltransferase FemA/FemB family protein [Candidatus Microgenomates bacterium]
MIKIVEITESKEVYNKLATHPLQSWEWGEFKKSQGHKVLRLGLYEGKNLKEVFQFSFHPPLLSLTIGYLPKSILPNKEVLEKIREICKENRAIFIKIEPNTELSSGKVSEFQRLGLTKGKPLFTKYTSVIDLTKPEEEIFKNLKSKTRYNIRLAQKNGVKVQEDNSNKAFVKYLNLVLETTKRQGFYAHDKKYHRDQWKILRPAGISHLLTATFEGKTLASFLLFKFNDILYYPYGASTREHKELMAPTLLMWEAIKFGKRMGCKSFDLWGDIEPNPPANHPYFGFHRFKEGFSPKLVEFVGSYDLVINPTLYQIYQLIDKIRWGILRLKSKLS